MTKIITAQWTLGLVVAIAVAGCTPVRTETEKKGGETTSSAPAKSVEPAETKPADDPFGADEPNETDPAATEAKPAETTTDAPAEDQPKAKSDDSSPAETKPEASKPDPEKPADTKPEADKPEADKPKGDNGDDPGDDAAKTDPAAGDNTVAAATGTKSEAEAQAALAKLGGDWPQWGGTAARNNVPEAKNIPAEWSIGKFDRATGEWDNSSAKNIKWVARLGSQSYGNPTVADGRIYIGTNNGAGWLARFPAKVDLGCLLCFNLADGKLLWQHSSEKLPTGRVHDWPLQGICCAPLIEGKRLWFVTSRGEVRCLDAEGFHDGENDGPFKDEDNENKDEADVLWVFDMMKELGISQHNMCSCSVTALGDVLLVNTSNGLDETHINLPAPDAPSFIALDKNSGKVLWTDKSPGANILHGQWSSPACAVLGGVPQAIFGGGDGWVYSFDVAGDGEGKAKLLWKFDANPKDSKWQIGGSGTRNNIIATPVIYKGMVYVAVGQDPEHAEGQGHLWCIDPTKRGDVSPQLAFNVKDLKTPIPHKRIQAVVEEDGDVARPNPNSAAVWHYANYDQNGDGELEFEETMHRSCGTVAIKDDILYIADFSGLFHCLDALTGKVHWTYDMLAAAWGSPLIVDGKVYVGDEDGDVCVFKHDTKMDLISEISMGNSVYSTPIVAGGVLYISNRTHLFAIEAPKSETAAGAE